MFRRVCAFVGMCAMVNDNSKLRSYCLVSDFRCKK